MADTNKTTLLDACWNKIEEEYSFIEHIDQEGSFFIEATTIKQFREARLATKFDHKSELPTLFKEHDLSILPTSRGTYQIAHIETFQTVDASNFDKVGYFPIPSDLESIKFDDITSESAAINAAFASGILADFLGESELFPTASGRQGSGTFQFSIKGTKDFAPQSISVSNSQIEIDAGYEGHRCLALVEAKLGLVNDFMLRQLYYPYRVWSVKVEKPVRPIFLAFSNSSFYLFEYEFSIPGNYNSAKLRQSARYSIVPINITRGDIQHVFENTESLCDESTTAIQADSIDRVLDLVTNLQKSEMTKEQITELYGFTPRQTDYYLNAARYLGLATYENRSNCCKISTDGTRYANMDVASGRLFICELMFRHQIFHDLYEITLKTGGLPSKQLAAELIEDNTNLTGETPRRRASSYLSWLRWMLSLDTDGD